MTKPVRAGDNRRKGPSCRRMGPALLSAIVLALTGACDLVAAGPVAHTVRQGEIDNVPALGSVEEGFWIAFNSGDTGLVPGPSDQVQQGVARVSEEFITKLVTEYEWTPRGKDWHPVMNQALVDKVAQLNDGGGWMANDDFDDSVALNSNFSGAFFLNDDNNLVAFSLVRN